MAEISLGLMRHRCDLERRSIVLDTYGGQSTAWSTLSSGIWAFIEQLTGRELEAAQAIRATDTHKVTIRYLPGLTAKDRLVYTDPEGLVRYYYLSDVVDLDMRHRFHECTAVEGLGVS